MRSGGPKQNARWRSNFGTGTIILALFILFIVSVVWFRKPKPSIETRFDSIATVLTADPISEAVLKGVIDTESKTAELFLVNTQTSAGQANRGKKDERYFFEMKTTLPEIDREKFAYETWLLQLIPYRFFSLGQMTTNELGEFVIEWEAKEGENYDTYTNIVITRQEIGGNTDPQIHIAEGVFGKPL